MNECRLLGLRLLYSLVRRGLVVAFFRLAESTCLQLRQLLFFVRFTLNRIYKWPRSFEWSLAHRYYTVYIISNGGIRSGLASFTDRVVILLQGQWHLRTVEATSGFH